MSDDIIRISDYERRSREPDAVSPRDPADAAVIAFPKPMVRHEDGGGSLRIRPGVWPELCLER